MEANGGNGEKQIGVKFYYNSWGRIKLKGEVRRSGGKGKRGE